MNTTSWLEQTKLQFKEKFDTRNFIHIMNDLTRQGATAPPVLLRFRAFVPVIAIVASVLTVCAPQAQAQGRGKGNFNVSAGLGYATETSTFSDGTTESGGTEVGFVLNADYRYPLTRKFSVGPALQYWSLGGSNDTAVSALLGYALDESSDLYLTVGNGFRLGYSKAFGKARAGGKGTFYTAEFVAPDDDRVDSFGYLGIGYRF